MAQNNIEFGLFLRMRDDYPSILKLAQEADKRGFTIGYVNDHLLNLRDETLEFLEAWTVMTAIGVQTNLRVSHTVICNSFRNPALLAKMGATLDVITKGRFELGIGAGWHDREYQAYGFDFPKPAVRVQQLAEALQIIRQLWMEGETTFQGKYYTLDKCINLPKPIQKPHPPIMVGGKGDMLLKATVEYVDEYNLPSSHETLTERIQYIHNCCDKIGRNPKELRFSLFPRLVLATDETELEQLINQYKPNDRSRKEFLATALVGTPDMVIDQVQKYVDIGVTRFALLMQKPVPERLELFANTVMKEFT